MVNMCVFVSSGVYVIYAVFLSKRKSKKRQKKQVQEKYHAVLVVNGTTTKDVVLAILMDDLSQERVF